MSLTPRIDRLEAGNNVIINGAFDFWQRATTFSNANGVTADRWRYSSNADGQVTVSRNTDVPTRAQSGFNSSYSMNAQVTTQDASLTTNQYAQFIHRLEGYDYMMLHGRNVRLQFWIKSNLTGTYSISFVNSGSSRTYITEYTINAADTWELKTIDLTLDTTGTWLFDNGIGLAIHWQLGQGPTLSSSLLDQWQSATAYGSTNQVNWLASTSNYIRMSNVMLVEGEYADDTELPFKRCGRTIQEELAKCQRYYEKTYNVDVLPGTVTDVGELVGAISAFNPGTALICWQCKVQKRTASTTYVIYNPTNGGASGMRVGSNNEGATVFDQSERGVNASAGGNFSTFTTVSCRAQFTADAEL